MGVPKPEAARRRARELYRDHDISLVEIERITGVSHSTLHRWFGARRLAVSVVCGRKHCARCGHWRPIHEFPPRTWNDDGTIRYVQPNCYSCKNRRQSEAWHSHTPAERLVWNEKQRAAYWRRNGQPLPEETLPDRVAVESFRPYWDAIRRRGLNATRLGVAHSKWDSVAKRMQDDSAQTLSLEVVDLIMTAAGLTDQIQLLYLVDGTNGL